MWLMIYTFCFKQIVDKNKQNWLIITESESLMIDNNFKDETLNDYWYVYIEKWIWEEKYLIWHSFDWILLIT